MKFERKIGVVLVCMVLPYMCAVAAFVLYAQAHLGPVPRWISLTMLGAMILTFVVGGVVVSRLAKKQAARETAEEAKLRRARASKGLKTGLVVYILILLNGVRLLFEHAIPWVYGAPGLAVVLLMVITTWASLKKLKKAEALAQAAGHNQTSQ